ncbi:MAG: hypothetical protein HZA25_00235 [Candidatus Niyogibacteria bacterium]|nr:hypothetical protein [Candidatus Niyogibacteria bacterium]
MNYKALSRISSLGLFIAIALILPFLAQAAVQGPPSPFGLIPCGNKGQGMCTLSDLVILIDQIINFALFYLAAPLGALSIAVGGVLMITAGGDTGQLERGKSIFYNTVIGFVVAFGAWLIVQAILMALVPSGSTAFTKLKDYINL